MKYFIYLFVLWVAVCTSSFVYAADVQAVNKAPVAVQTEGLSATPVKATPVKATPVKATSKTSLATTQNKIVPAKSPVVSPVSGKTTSKIAPEKNAKSVPSKTKPTAASLKPVVKGGVTEEIGLMLQNILLYQGEGGSELWRLQASYASMATDDDVTSVEAPVVRYTLGDPALKDYVHVTALKGKITENQRFLVLSGDVQVWRADQRITGPMMRYDAKTRTMTFLKGARLSTSAGAGSTKVLSWQLDDNILRARGAVDVLLK